METSPGNAPAGGGTRWGRGWIALAVVTGLFVAAAAVVFRSEAARFFVGGAMMNLGYKLQDPIEAFDFAHHHEVTPTQVWDEVRRQNVAAAAVRSQFPRATHHPLVAVVACMDARIDTNELFGDTRKYYYVIRTAGSVLGVKEEEMLELAVRNGVEVVLFTTHTQCAAEAVASSSDGPTVYPELTRAVRERDTRFQEFLARPEIAARVASGRLLVRRATIDTSTLHLDAQP